MPSQRLAVALLLAALAAPAEGLVSDAPLGVGTPGLFRALFLDSPLADARGAAPALDVRWWMANSWSTPTVLARGDRSVDVSLDAQTDSLQVTATLPWSLLSGAPFAARLTTAVEARLLVTWGGWTDGPIEAWHRLFGFNRFQRQLWPRDDVKVFLRAHGGPAAVSLRSGRLALGDVAVRTALRLAGDGTPGSRFALALRADLKLPTGELARLGGSGRPDAGLGLALTWAPRRWLTLHAMGSARVVSDLPGGLSLQPRRLQASWDLSLVLRPWRTVALILEERASTPLFRGGWTVAAPPDEPEATAYYALLRAQAQVSGGVRVGEVTLYFSEDFTLGKRMPGDEGPPWFYDSNSPDVVLGVAWARRF